MPRQGWSPGYARFSDIVAPTERPGRHLLSAGQRGLADRKRSLRDAWKNDLDQYLYLICRLISRPSIDRANWGPAEGTLPKVTRGFSSVMPI